MLSKHLFKIIIVQLLILTIYNSDCFQEKSDIVNKLIEEHTIDNSSIQLLAETKINLKEHADNMINFLDQSADPCNDFHKYACGNWKKYHEIPDDKPSYDVFTKLNDILRESILDILTEKIDLKHENNIYKEIQNFFNSCNNTEIINERKTEPLLEFLKRLGGFPLLDGNWTEKNFNFESILSDLATYGVRTFFCTTVLSNLEEKHKNMIYIFNPVLGLKSYDDYLKDYNKEHLNAYRDFIIEILKIFNANENKIYDTADEIIMLEKRLAKLTDTRKLDHTQRYIPKKIGELMTNYPKLNWKTYFNKIFNQNFNDSIKIAFFTGPNIDDIYDLLFNTDKRIIANYLNWIAINRFVPYLDDQFKDAREKLNKAITGSVRTALKRELICATETNENLGQAVSSIYIKKYFDKNSKKAIFQIGEEIINKFRENLYTSDWLDKETIIKAEQKLNKTKLELGYPSFLLNQTKINMYFNSLKFQPDKYFENILNVCKFELEKEIEELNSNITMNDWPVHPTIINAFFEPFKNRIIIPAGFLQPPMYHKDYPKALNYGAIGAFIGHELTHGFDSNGRKFDENGNIKNWWTKKSFDMFQEKEKCFIDFYNQFTIYNKTLNGDLSKRENIADNGGVQMSFKVYKEWLDTSDSQNKINETLPGLEFLSPEQLFFVSFGQAWCDYIRPEAIEFRLSVDEHPPGSIRMLGALQNFEEFSKAFQCPVNSYMNPSRKCKLW